VIHSVPAQVGAGPCEVAVRAPQARLRPYVTGFSGFRSVDGRAIEHLLLPLAAPTLIVDFGSPSGLVTGARATATSRGETRWGHGVSAGLTPLGAAALFGLPMRELTGAVPLADLLGRAATELPGQLGAPASWLERFDLLEAVLTARLTGAAAANSWRAAGTPAFCGIGSVGADRARSGARAARPERIVSAAWWRLQRADSPRVGALADQLGVTRRRLERGFRQHLGMSPATVARIARFQRVVARFGSGATPSEAAAESGFADHSHLARETRAMAGLTPTGLAAFLATPPVLVSHSSKTGDRVRP
jgi:AraC-like DNA-binding protein